MANYFEEYLKRLDSVDPSLDAFQDAYRIDRGLDPMDIDDKGKDIRPKPYEKGVINEDYTYFQDGILKNKDDYNREKYGTPRSFNIADMSGDVEPELTPSQLIDMMRAKKLKDAKDEKALVNMEKSRTQNFDKATKKSKDKRKKAEEAAVKVAKESEKFVPRDTLLGRIFDKRVKSGEEISNADKTSAMLRNISDNLLERRLVGGKEGTDTLSRILGPSGGVRAGMEEIELLEDEAIALREKGETKKAAAVEQLLKNEKTAYEIKKIDSEAIKNIAEVMQTDYTKATQEAMELAALRGFKPNTPEYNAEVDSILSSAITEGQANVYTKLIDLRQKLQILPEGSPERAVIERDIAEMEQRSRGTTLDSDYAPEQVTDQYGINQ